MLTSTESDNIELVRAAMNGILVDHDEGSVDRNFHPEFVQHNPWAKDGAAHVREMCAFRFRLRALRWAAQGDLVAYHGLYTGPNPLGDDPLLCVDVWRVHEGRIVEHWDALQPTPTAEAELMIAGDGDGSIATPPGVAAHRAVRARKLFECGVGRADASVVRAACVQTLRMHRLDLGDGTQAWIDVIQAETPRVTVQRTIASGDLVFVHLELATATERHAAFEVVRFDELDRVTDRWTVMQPIVSREHAANPHPHF